jgi:hypothetical protein
MLPGIRVVPNRPRDELHKMSRVDFSRMYTVEHNVKVSDFGDVHPSHAGRLQSQWITTITGGGSGDTRSHSELGTILADDKEEEDEDEDEEVEDSKGHGVPELGRI